jgi:hypothetical protein
VSPMRYLSPYFRNQNRQILITPQQASDFAKSVAGDFNPLHDPDSRRFCVPGDLLFALVVDQFGLSQRMDLRFRGMVGANRVLDFQESDATEICIQDTEGKTYLEVHRSGSVLRDTRASERLTRAYVAFSGQNFPHVLVPLMRDHGVMVNPERPLVIYESMCLELLVDDPEILAGAIDARLERSSMHTDGKRGQVDLEYTLCHAGNPVAKGSKRMMIGALLPFDADRVVAMTERYLGFRENYRPVVKPMDLTADS